MQRFHPTLSRPWAVLALALLTAALTATVAPAATITWINAAGGSWSNAANWSPAGVPGASDVAVLPAISGAYTVTLDVNPSAAQLDIAAGDPTLDMNGRSIASVGVIENSGTIANFAGPYTGSQMHNHTGGFVVGAYDGVITMSAGDIITNDGTIVVGPGSNSALSSGGIVKIDGSGTLKLDHTRVFDIAGPAEVGGWLKILPNQTLTGTGKITKRIENQGTWLVDEDHAVVDVIALTYNRGTLRIANHAKLHISGGLGSEGGVITTGEGGGTLDMAYIDRDTGLPNGNYGTVSMLRGGSLVIDGGGDLDLHAGALYGGTILRNGDTGILNMDMGSMQQLTIDASAEVLSTSWSHWQTPDHLVINGLYRLAGQFICGLADTAVKDTTWLSGTGVLQLEDGILGTGETARVLVNEITIRGHGTINPPFQNDGTVDVDQLAIGGNGRAWINRNLLRIQRGGLRLGGTRTVLRNQGRFDANGLVVVEKGAAIDNRGGTIWANGNRVALGTSSTTGTIVGGRLEGTGTGDYFVARGATLRDVTLGRGGVLQVAPNASAIASGVRFTSQGTVRLASTGRLVMDGTTQFLQTEGALRLDGGSLVSSRDVQVQSGRLEGFGTISANLVNRGTVAPDVGRLLRVAGGYTQLAGGTLRCTIAGSASDQRSLFGVDGNAALAGLLLPVLADGFVPATGAAFPVFTYGSRTGTFDPVTTAATTAAVPGLVPLFEASSMSLVAHGTTSVGGEPLTGTLRFFGTGAAFVLELPAAATVDGRVYDAAGREVARLGGGALAAGVHRFAIRDLGTRDLASGVYFARVKIAANGLDVTRTTRAVVLR